MKKLSKVAALALSLLMVAGTFSGCGGSTSPAGGSESAPGTASSAQNGAHVLNIAKLLELQACDPHKVNDGMSNELLTAVFDGLYTLNEKGELDPLMAESYDVSEDGLTYTFHLRDVKWSNGDSVTAHDFVFSWRRLVDTATAAKNRNEAVAAGIKNADAIVNGNMDSKELGVSAADDKTLVVQLEGIVPYFLATLVRPAFLPINQKYLESAGEQYGMTPETTIYNGPFAWTYWDFATNISAEKNKDYWNASNIDVDEINWKIVKDSQTGALMFENGELDFVEINGNLINNYMNNPAFTRALEVHMWYMIPNFQNPALANVNLRQALATSYDKEAIANTVMNNGAQAANYFVGYNLCYAPDGKTTMRDTNGDNFLKYDAASAQELWKKGLQELGTDSVKLRLMYYDDDASITQAEFIASEWEKNLPGLTVELNSFPKASTLTKAQDGDFDVYLFRWGPDYKDPMAFLELVASDSERDYGKYVNPEYDAIIQDARRPEMLNKPQARWDSLANAEKILLEQDAAIFPTVQNGLGMLINPKVHGLEVRNTSITWNYRFVKVDD